MNFLSKVEAAADTKKFSDDLVLELTEMKKIGTRVPDKAIAYAKNLELIEDLTNMKVSECASLILELVS